jgi:hypothetical protein
MDLLYCCDCRDVIAPGAWHIGDRPWDWCACAQAGMRRGSGNPLEVTAAGGPGSVRIIGLSEAFLATAVATPPAGYGVSRAWRKLHASHTADADPGGSFLERDCWAVVLRPGDNGAVTFIPYAEVPECARPGFLLPELARPAVA